MHAIQSSPLVQAIGWTLLQSLWQIALVGIILWLLLNFISKRSAQLSYAFSTSALLVICIWTGLTFSNYYEFSFSKKEIATVEMTDKILPQPNQASNESIIENSPIVNPAFTNAEASAVNLEMILACFVFLWMVGILFFGIKFTRGWFYLKELKKTKLPLPDIQWQNRINDFAQQMGISKNVQFFLSEKINSPITFGHFKPIVLFPATMLTGLSDKQIEMLLLHELAHIRRSDFLVNLVQSILEVILFYHPVVWWISKQIKNSREHCCDDMAVAICNDRFLYAKTLTEIQSSIFFNKKSLAMSATGNQGTFTYRIQRLFQQRNHKSSYTKSVFSFGLIAICLMVFAFQQPFSDDEEKTEEGIISFIITPEKSKEDLQKIKQTLSQENIDIEFDCFGDDKSKMKRLSAKITLTDKSTYQLDVDEFNYAFLSFDWSKTSPLTVFAKAKQNCSSTYSGPESFLSQQTFDNSNTNLCVIGDFSFQRKNSFSDLEFYISNGNETNSIFILNNKKISKSALQQKRLEAIDIFSIKKLSTIEANKHYGIDDFETKVYEIITKYNVFFFDKKLLSDECCESIIHGGPVKITSDKSLDENFNPPLYFMNGIKLSIPEGERLPIDVKNLEMMDSIIMLTGKKATDIYGDEGKNGVWLIYATDKPLDKKTVYHQFSNDEKSDFEKSIQIHPNPMVDESVISYEIEEDKHVRLQIVDNQGNLVTTLHDGVYTKPSYGVKFHSDKIVYLEYWRPKNIPSGIYFARIEVGGEVFTKKIVKVNQ